MDYLNNHGRARTHEKREAAYAAWRESKTNYFDAQTTARIAEGRPIRTEAEIRAGFFRRYQRPDQQDGPGMFVDPREEV